MGVERQYVARVSNAREKGWGKLLVGIFKTCPGGALARVGGYERNYRSFFRTFLPFQQGDKALALYSRDYTATRVMELPSCRDIGGEEPASAGFCPVDYYVLPASRGKWALVAGCVWGDDSSWKVQVLDLSRAADGVIVRSEALGYVELPEGMTLAEAANQEDWAEDYKDADPEEGWPQNAEPVYRETGRLRLACSHWVDIDSGHPGADIAFRAVEGLMPEDRVRVMEMAERWCRKCGKPHAAKKKDGDPAEWYCACAPQTT